MRLFGREPDPESEAERKRQEESRIRLEKGGLPLNAIERLEEQAARQGTPGHLFTGDLSVPELMLVRRAGWSALGQVMGSSTFFINGPFSSGVSGELNFLTTAYNQVRRLATGRLQQEAALLGATGVVGVRLLGRKYQWGEGLLEFTAIGTAIRENETATGKEAKSPFLSALSGEAFWTLHQAGFRPVGLAIGNCAYYKVGSTMQNTVRTNPFGFGSGQNIERADFTQGVYNARALAMGRMEQEAREAGAEGIVGVTVEVETHGTENGTAYTDMFCHFVAIGTAVARMRGGASAGDPPFVLEMK